MSTLKVEIVEINDVLEHPNADRLDLVQIKGWQCIAQKGVFKQGNKVIYFPIDSILPHDVEEKIFGPDSKIKLHNSRVKTIKLRKAISQGLVVPSSLFGFDNEKVGTDLTKKLGVKKYEQPVRASTSTNKFHVSKKQINPNFRKYTEIENFKNYTDVFKESDIVVATEKIHGSNFRASWVPNHPNKWWKKILKLFRLLPQWEFVYGSHNVQLQNRTFGYKGYYDNNVYAEAVKKYQLKEKLCYGEAVYGEIYGPSIQKGYSYGCQKDERKMIVFDVMIDGAYLSHTKMKSFCVMKKLDTVPVLYCGPFIKEEIAKVIGGKSVLNPSQAIREGAVIKTITEQRCYMGRKILKWINDEYLLKVKTEFH